MKFNNFILFLWLFWVLFFSYASYNVFQTDREYVDKKLPRTCRYGMTSRRHFNDVINDLLNM